MLINKMGKSFGPGASVSGQILFVFGIVISFFSLKGLILVLIGAFIGFTCSTSRIDSKKKRVRYSTDLFGLIPVGKWIECRNDMHISTRQVHRSWKVNSYSNKSIDLEESGCELLLTQPDGTPVVPLMRTSGREEAEEHKKEISRLLGFSNG